MSSSVISNVFIYMRKVSCDMVVTSNVVRWHSSAARLCCSAASLFLSFRMCLFIHLLTDSLFIYSPWMFIGWHQHLNPNHCWRCVGWLDSHCSDRLCDWSKKDLCWISDPLNPVCNQSWNITGFPSLVLGVHVQSN